MQTYLLKMSRSGEEGEKTFLLLEAGVRLHTTEVRHSCYVVFHPVAGLSGGAAW